MIHRPRFGALTSIAIFATCMLAAARSGAGHRTTGAVTIGETAGSNGHAENAVDGGQSIQGRGRAAPSPASKRPPKPAAAQTYSPEQIRAGQPLFAAQCGFCHGRDAAGGEGGPDLTRSMLVAEDVRGDKIGPVVRTGRITKGMPAFNLAAADLAAIVAFIHDQQVKAESQAGGRRFVDVADLQTGDAAAGKEYFNRACANCHAPDGDLAGVASRLRGLDLLRRMLHPTSGRGEHAPSPAKVAVTLPTGETIAGKLAYRDEFTIALTDADGWYRSWPTARVTFTVDDPLRAHVEQLAKYTDEDMHNVLAYLQTLVKRESK